MHDAVKEGIDNRYNINMWIKEREKAYLKKTLPPEGDSTEGDMSSALADRFGGQDNIFNV